MIDEKLYQQAADELNSNQRRPHIWTRACALASDDHDEARYLYTNLRVEELITERDAARSTQAGAASAVTGAEAALALEPLDFSTKDAAEITAPLSTPAGHDPLEHDDDMMQLDAYTSDGDDITGDIDNAGLQQRELGFQDVKPSLDGQPDQNLHGQAGRELTGEPVGELDAAPAAGIAHDERFAPLQSPEESLLSEEELDQTIDFTSELEGTAVFEFSEHEIAQIRQPEPDDYNPSSMLSDDDLDVLLGGVYEGHAPQEDRTDPLADFPEDELAMTAEFQDLSHTQSLHGHDLDWLDDDLGPDSREEAGDRDAVGSRDAEVTQNLPVPHQPTVRTRAVPYDQSFGDTDRLAQELSRQADEMPGQKSDVVSFGKDSRAHDPKNSDPTEAQHAGDAAVPVAARTVELPVDVSDGLTGSVYAVYRRGHQVQAVKDGVSWPALFMTLPYLVYRHLFGTAIVYALLWVIVLAGLLASSLVWMDAGAAVDPMVQISTAGFALLAVVGLLYLPFRNANQWREEKLSRRGFELVAWTRASSPGKAISEARRAAALD